MLRAMSGNPLTRNLLKLMYKPRTSLPVELFGHTYDHPFGLAAGMDKNAKALRGWEATGLSFVEIGGVTMLEQLEVTDLAGFMFYAGIFFVVVTVIVAAIAAAIAPTASQCSAEPPAAKHCAFASAAARAACAARRAA